MSSKSVQQERQARECFQECPAKRCCSLMTVRVISTKKRQVFSFLRSFLCTLLYIKWLHSGSWVLSGFFCCRLSLEMFRDEDEDSVLSETFVQERPLEEKTWPCLQVVSRLHSKARTPEPQNPHTLYKLVQKQAKPTFKNNKQEQKNWKKTQKNKNNEEKIGRKPKKKWGKNWKKTQKKLINTFKKKRRNRQLHRPRQAFRTSQKRVAESRIQGKQMSVESPGEGKSNKRKKKKTFFF